MPETKRDRAIAQIADDMTAGLIDEQEAYDRLIEAGLTPRGARAHVERWAARPPLSR